MFGYASTEVDRQDDVVYIMSSVKYSKTIYINTICIKMNFTKF